MQSPRFLSGSCLPCKDLGKPAKQAPCENTNKQTEPTLNQVTSTMFETEAQKYSFNVRGLKVTIGKVPKQWRNVCDLIIQLIFSLALYQEGEKKRAPTTLQTLCVSDTSTVCKICGLVERGWGRSWVSNRALESESFSTHRSCLLPITPNTQHSRRGFFLPLNPSNTQVEE